MHGVIVLSYDFGCFASNFFALVLTAWLLLVWVGINFHIYSTCEYCCVSGTIIKMMKEITNCYSFIIHILFIV